MAALAAAALPAMWAMKWRRDMPVGVANVIDKISRKVG
jgi:hypothetical protein